MKLLKRFLLVYTCLSASYYTEAIELLHLKKSNSGYSTAAANSGFDISTQQELDPDPNKYQGERINNQPMPQNYDTKWRQNILQRKQWSKSAEWKDRFIWSTVTQRTWTRPIHFSRRADSCTGVPKRAGSHWLVSLHNTQLAQLAIGVGLQLPMLNLTALPIFMFWVLNVLNPFTIVTGIN